MILSLGVSALALDRIDCTRGVEGRVLIIQKTLTTVSSVISIISLLLEPPLVTVDNRQ